MAGLSSKGCRRTQIWTIQGADVRQLAFSKRRSALFKKARELCTLCAAETILVIFSPGGKAFSFGHPGVDTIMIRVSNCGKTNFDAIRRAEEQEATLSRLNKEYSDVLKKLEAEKIRVERLKQICLVGRPLDELNSEELLTLKPMMDEFMEKLRKRMQELPVETVASTPLLAGESNAFLSGPTEGDSSADPCDHDVGHEH